MLFDVASLIEIMFRHVDATAAGRVLGAIVLLLAVIGSWGTFGGGDVAEISGG